MAQRSTRFDAVIDDGYEENGNNHDDYDQYQAFADGLKPAAAKQSTVHTANGALVYSTNGDARTDFIARATEFRNSSPEKVADAFMAAYREDPVDAIVLAFQLGDIREGKGERSAFKACLDVIGTKHPEVMAELLPLIPEYSRWDYAAELMLSKNPDTARNATKLVVNQLKADMQAIAEGKESISLLAKWLPSVQSKKPAKRRLAHLVMRAMKMDFKHYRQTLGMLRAKLNIIEKFASQGNLKELNQEAMTSKQQLKYDAMLMKHIPEERLQFFKDVHDGKAKMNASVLTPHEVVFKYTPNGIYQTTKPQPALELLWSLLPDKVNGNGNTIVVRDGSGSMMNQVNPQTKCSMLHVSTALAIYCAEKLSGPFKDKFITFSSRPEIVDISSAKTLAEKINICAHYDDCSNTNIEKTFDMLLDIAVKNRLKQDQIPKNLLILSDMEFDSAMSNSFTTNRSSRWGMRLPDKDTLLSQIRDKWTAAGYELPTLVFWHLNADRTIFPEIDSKNGIINLSGFSTNTLDMVMEGKFEIETKVEKENGEVVTEKKVMTPFEQMKAVVGQERYDPVREAATRGLEQEKANEDWFRDVAVKSAEEHPRAMSRHIGLDEESIESGEECVDDLPFGGNGSEQGDDDECL